MYIWWLKTFIVSAVTVAHIFIVSIASVAHIFFVNIVFGAHSIGAGRYGSTDCSDDHKWRHLRHPGYWCYAKFGSTISRLMRSAVLTTSAYTNPGSTTPRLMRSAVFTTSAITSLWFALCSKSYLFLCMMIVIYYWFGLLKRLLILTFVFPW